MAIAIAYERIVLANFPKTTAEHAQRVAREAARIAKLAQLAEDVGCTVSQGDSELAMMRVIDESGWRGRIGVLVPPGDAAVELQRQLEGLRWIAGELRLTKLRQRRPDLPTKPWWPQ